MKILAIKCNKCKDTIFSRSSHDFRTCTCMETAVDGGQTGCIRILSSGWTKVDLELNVTLEVLHNDWNSRKNKYGLIKNKHAK